MNTPESAAASQPKTPASAIWSLVLGIASLVLCLSCMTGIPGLVLGVIGVNNISKSGGALKGKGIAITGLVLSAVGILWTPIVASISIPVVSQVTANARITKSEANLRMISTSCHLYASYHDGDIPPNLDALVEEGMLDAAQLVSPLAPKGEPTPHYELLLQGKLESHPEGDVMIQDRFTIGFGHNVKRPTASVSGVVSVVREDEIPPR